MRWILAALASPGRIPFRLRQAPKRNRLWTFEDLEGRRLLSRGFTPIATLNGLVSSNIISGPDGKLWVAIDHSNPNAAAGDSEVIERIGLHGWVTSIRIPNLPGDVFDPPSITSLTIGPDGNIWFVANQFQLFETDGAGYQILIGKGTSTGVVTEFPPLPVVNAQEAWSYDIVSGPGGDLWFSDSVFNQYPASDPSGLGYILPEQDFIGRVTTAGAVTLFPVSAAGSQSSIEYGSLAAGADGNLWFTQATSSGPSFFGRMSPSGVVTPFPLGNLYGASVANGQNGSLIVTGEQRTKGNERDVVFNVSTTGAVTPYKLPAAKWHPFETYQISADGSLWLTDVAGLEPGEIGRITASGAATAYSLSHFAPASVDGVDSMAVGPDSKLYVLADVTSGLGYEERLYRFSPNVLPAARAVSGPRPRR